MFKKGTIQVMGFIIVLLLCLFAYLLIVKDGGVLKTGYNAVAEVVNSTWTNISGSPSSLLSKWGGATPSNTFDETTAETIIWE